MCGKLGLTGKFSNSQQFKPPNKRPQIKQFHQPPLHKFTDQFQDQRSTSEPDQARSKYIASIKVHQSASKYIKQVHLDPQVVVCQKYVPKLFVVMPTGGNICGREGPSFCGDADINYTTGTSSSYHKI